VTAVREEARPAARRWPMRALLAVSVFMTTLDGIPPSSTTLDLWLDELGKEEST
jgi:hypothetical protein